MATKKSRYRKFRDGGAVRSDGSMAGTPTPLEVEVDTPKAHIAADVATAQMMPAIEAAAAPVDDTSIAFQKQIDALRNAEALQRQRNHLANFDAAVEASAAQAAPPPLTKNQAAFLEANPEIVKYPDIAVRAIFDAHQQGHEPDSEAFHQAVKSNFDNHVISRITPEIQRDEPTPSGPRGRASMFSAPVSRETRATGSYNSYGERPGQVRLTVAMKEAARIAGISELEYAEQVLRLREEKAAGNYGGQS